MAHWQWAYSMGSTRAHIVLPEALIAEIDAAVGPRGRSAFLVETAQAELRRRRLLSFLRSDEPAWSEKAHPELKGGSTAWVGKLRKESDQRLQAAISPRARK